MTKDLNKGISNISYNLLNLPQQVDILSPVAEARNAYSYSADGVKLRVVKKYNSNFNTSPVIGSTVNVSSMDVTKTTDYVENKIFENNTLDRILVDGGYIKDGVYHFYETDHLGDNRTVINQPGTVTQRNDYYPFGMQMEHNDPNLGVFVRIGDEPNAFKFSGKELDVMHGLNLYDSQARWYDPCIPVLPTPDPLAEKYYSWSPYVYCADNPLRYVDYRGDSISLAGLQGLDRVLNTDYTGTLKSDLESKTGLTYSIGSNGQMSYTKDSNGNPVISTTTDANGNVVQVGSTTARNLMINAIDNSSTVTVSAGVRSVTDGPANAIGLSYSQIDRFIQGTHGLDNTTLGWGMTFMHEINHTNVGGGLPDAPYNPGPVVTIMNTIRSELNAQGGNYGQRLEYFGTPIGSNIYLPFNSASQSLINGGIIPIMPTDKFIRFPK